jgi:hypothetical protein
MGKSGISNFEFPVAARMHVQRIVIVEKLSSARLEFSVQNGTAV